VIARLRGVLEEFGPDWAVIDVGGVGYLVYCSARTLRELAPRGQVVALSIETHVREDHIHLYGFATTAERDWFRLLTTVQGVGARVALAILGVLGDADLAQAIAAQDKAALAQADGVGPKLAQRIVNELKDKAGVALGPVAIVAPGAVPAVADARTADAVSALVNLGYGRSEAFGAVAEASRALGEEAGLDVLIPTALKELAQRGAGA